MGGGGSDPLNSFSLSERGGPRVEIRFTASPLRGEMGSGAREPCTVWLSVEKKKATDRQCKAHIHRIVWRLGPRGPPC